MKLENRIKILKTGLYDVNRYIDFSVMENREYFERLAVPGTELTLIRKSSEDNPWEIEVHSQDGMLLGKVTCSKCETVARMMDSGLEIIAIVNGSMPHNSDEVVSDVINIDDPGWSRDSRRQEGYEICNLPYGIYYVEQ